MSRSAWPLVIALASVAYLALELAFNARLLDTSVLDPDAIDIPSLEYLGRTISATGFVLIILRALPFQRLAPLRAIPLALVAGVISFASMYHTQGWIVDALVARASPALRQDAYVLVSTRAAIARDDIRLSGIPGLADGLETARAKTLFGLLGPLSLSDDSFVAATYKAFPAIVDAAAETGAQKALASTYPHYSDWQTRIAQGWTQYAEAQSRYRVARTEIDREAARHWEDLSRFAETAWQAQLGQVAREMTSRKINLTRMMVNSYFDALKTCAPDACAKKKAQAEARLNAQLPVPVDLDDWCRETVRSRQGSVIMSGGALSMARQTGRECRALSNQEVEQDLRHALGADSKADFLKSPIYRQALDAKISKLGIDAPDKAALTNRAAFMRAMHARATDKIDKDFSRRIEEKTGYALPPDLDQSRFVPWLVTHGVGDDLCPGHAKKLRLSMTPKAYFDACLAPGIAPIRKRLLAPSEADPSQFAAQGAYFAAGDTALRVLTIIPVAMAFSLAFAAINALGMMRSGLGKTAGKKKAAITTALLATVLLVAPVTIGRIGIATNTIEGRMFDAISLPVRLAATWVLGAEPILYPIGAQLAPTLPSTTLKEESRQ